MTALSESFYLMSIHNVFSWPISTFLLFSRIGKPVLDSFTQTHGIDYHKTFSPVAKFTSKRMVLALAAILNLEVHQVDVKNAYLNAELSKTVYMAQPPGFIKTSQHTKVCKLSKALYGLKQGGRCWYLRICEAFTKFGYMCCKVKHCMFYRRMDGCISIIVIAVDDLTLASDSPSLLSSCKSDLHSEFEISDM